eukprot:COSAG06_NODE_1620_length_8905_cov_255.644788_2_plen_109_part_00
MACRKDHVEIAACLLAFGADPTPSQGGTTALIRAQEDGKIACVALLQNASLTTEEQARRASRDLRRNEVDDEKSRHGKRLATIVREARDGQPIRQGKPAKESSAFLRA